VPTGAKIRASVKLDDVKEVGDGWWQVEQTWTIEVEGSEKPACVATSVGRVLA
jgi:hypothetical protein